MVLLLLMRLVCISDTHNLHVYQRGTLEVPEGDVLIHCGDATMRGSYEETALFAQWFASFPHKHKIFVPGNHDWSFYQLWKREHHRLAEIDWAHVLIDSEVVIDGKRFWGSPWQPEFHDWAFNLPRGPALSKVWAHIPESLDVLVTHSPPLGILDRVGREHVGCADMMMAVRAKKPKVHIFGHVHGGYGQMHRHGIHFANCSIANEAYFLKHPAVVIDL